MNPNKTTRSSSKVNSFLSSPGPASRALVKNSSNDEFMIHIGSSMSTDVDQQLVSRPAFIASLNGSQTLPQVSTPPTRRDMLKSSFSPGRTQS